MADPIETLRAGLTDRYVLGDEIGRGGMSIVYRGHDLRHDRDVAVKILRAELSAALGFQRFHREIRIAARLQHPHILPLYDSGEVEGLLYYVMPYVQGESLRERLARERQLPIPEALRIARQVGRALAYAHAQGVVHRDIKPENILLSSGLAIVADFGVARALLEAADDRVTDSGVTVGTPGYMSPEQAGGSANVDARSDIYSLGCVLFEMLAGEPPFTGPTPQAVMARHVQQPPPALHVVRATVPPPLEEAIERALAKAPADRYPTADEFVDALTIVDRTIAGRRVRTRRMRPFAIAGLVAAAAFAAWLAFRPGPVLDQNKVVVFPLVEVGLAISDSGAGYNVALVIEAALEHTAPLKWIDGWQRLDVRQRGNVALLTSNRARAITRSRGARYYLDGVVRQVADSTSVTLRLSDVAGDSLVSQETATAGGPAPLYQLALAAVRQILPQVLDPGRRVDFAPLSKRDPAAIALFIQGERQYRQARFEAALQFYQRAVAQDSGLVFAAVKGAQAASWTNRLQDAESLLESAVAQRVPLPTRYAQFARGMLAYVRGEADSAVRWLERAVASAPDWSEASMALGEAFYHLLPSRAPLDSLAAAAFEAAVRADTTFTPPLFHLAELAIRKGDTRGGQKLIDRFRGAEADRGLTRQIVLMLECVQRRNLERELQAAAEIDPGDVLVAAKSLAAGLAQPRCAEQGFRAVLGARASSPNQRWGALLGLHGLLVGLGRAREAVTLTDSAVASGLVIAPVLYPLDVIAGAPLEAEARALEEFARARFGATYEQVSNPQLLWLLGVWHAQRGQLSHVEAVHALLATRNAATEDRRTRLFSAALQAHALLLRRDTAQAIERLASLAPTAPRDSLEWEFGESLPVERLRLAELLLLTNRAEEAYWIAAGFDQPGPIINLPFVPASLAIRYRAAVMTGHDDWAAVARKRLLALGRGELIAAGVRTSFIQEVDHGKARYTRVAGARTLGGGVRRLNGS